MKTEKIATVSKRGELIIGKEFAGEKFSIEILKTGEMICTPVKVIPKNHETFFTKEAREQMKLFNEYISTEPSLTDPDEILASIRHERKNNATEEIEG